MKRGIFSIILFFTFLSVFANQEQKDSIYHSIYAWNITEKLGNIIPVKVDTLAINFQQTTTDIPYGIANSFNGNIGSPLESKIYFNRTVKSDFLFLKPYSDYYLSPSDFKFYNTKSPYSNIAYYRGGPSYGREERFKALFSVNVNPNFNLGFSADYIYGRGIYQNQSTNHFLGGLFGSYRGKRYEAHGIASLNNFKNYENGGIKNDLYISDPELIRSETGIGKYTPQDIEVNLPLKTASKLNNRYVYYNHKYHLGFEKTNLQDSSKMDFVPVTTFTHSIKFETDAKGYRETSIPRNFYQNFYYENDSIARDTASYLSLRNTFAISLNEGFNKLAKFGLTAFVTNNFVKYKFIQDSILHSQTENNISIGGELSKKLGSKFKYSALGEMCIMGERLGEFNIHGNISNLFPIKGDTLILAIKGFIKNEQPNFFLQQYESNHFRWNNNFENLYTTHLSGKIAIPTWGFEFNVGIENISNYIYFNRDGLPYQHKSNVQVLAFDLKQNFVLGCFHWENQAVYQLSGEQKVLPLPDWSLYSNLYYLKRLFKVLTVQLGAEIRYNTAYYAPYYMPATGQFTVQEEKKIGNYPVVDIYANLHLKRMRFFLMYYHANHNISETNYFSMLHYPMNPAMFKVGLSWNFYD